jgi:hypothetical protein
MARGLIDKVISKDGTRQTLAGREHRIGVDQNSNGALLWHRSKDPTQVCMACGKGSERFREENVSFSALVKA